MVFLRFDKMKVYVLIFVFLCIAGFSAFQHSDICINHNPSSIPTYPVSRERTVEREAASIYHKNDMDNGFPQGSIQETGYDSTGIVVVRRSEDEFYDRKGRRNYTFDASGRKHPRDFSKYQTRQTLDINGDGKKETFIVFRSGNSVSRVWYEVEIINQDGKNILFSELEQRAPITFSDRGFVQLVPDFQRQNRYMIITAYAKDSYKPTEWSIQVYRYSDKARDFYHYSEFDTGRKFEFPYDAKVPTARRRQIEDEVLKHSIRQLR